MLLSPSGDLSHTSILLFVNFTLSFLFSRSLIVARIMPSSPSKGIYFYLFKYPFIAINFQLHIMIESRTMFGMYPLLSLCFLVIEKPFESFGVICHKKGWRLEDNKDRPILCHPSRDSENNFWWACWLVRRQNPTGFWDYSPSHNILCITKIKD
jgi:hypothetical protein